MAEPFFPLTALSEAQRAQALERFAIIRPILEEGVSQAQVARTRKLAPSTVQLWIKRYREKGLWGQTKQLLERTRRVPALESAVFGMPHELPNIGVPVRERKAFDVPCRGRGTMAKTTPIVRGNTLTYLQDGQEQVLLVETPAWYAWL